MEHGAEGSGDLAAGAIRVERRQLGDFVADPLRLPPPAARMLGRLVGRLAAAPGVSRRTRREPPEGRSHDQNEDEKDLDNLGLG